MMGRRDGRAGARRCHVAILGCLSLLLVAAGGSLVTSTTIALGRESVTVPLDGRGWTEGWRKEAAAYVMVDWVLPGESTARWTEIVNAQAFDKRRTKLPPPEATMEQLRTVMRRGCAETVWRVLERRADGVLYEWRIPPPCAAENQQHQIARIFEGKRNRFRIAYTAKGPEMPGDLRDAWIRRFSHLKAVVDE